MLKTNGSRPIRSNSLNVPDGTVALSIQIPDTKQYRKSSVCSCSKCSWISETDQPLSAMTSSTDIDSISQMSYTRPHSVCNYNDTKKEHQKAIRSASADHIKNHESQDQSSSPPTVRSSRSSISTRPSLDSSCGQICIKLSYNLEMGSLDVNVVECRDLPHFGKHNPNPIIYISLLPDDGYLEHSKMKTKCKKNTHNPIYREIIKFPNITKFELDDRSLLFTVYHIDQFFSKKSIIGQVEIRIEDYPWGTDESIWMTLRKPIKLDKQQQPDIILEKNYDINTRRGILNFELSFNIKDEKAKKGDIHFYVKNGNNLTGDPPILAKMPFVKANILSNRKIVTSARSSLAEFKDNGFQPYWDYDIVIQNQSIDKLKKRALEISVWDRENSLNNRYIGRLLFYLADPTKKEKITQTLWRKLIENPGNKLSTELQLQP